MVASVPADDEIERVVLDAFLCLWCHAGARPCPLQIGTEHHQPLAIGRRRLGSG
jgi:hypothetical protein